MPSFAPVKHTNIKPTSRTAYEDIKDTLGDKQQAVYHKLIMKGQSQTNTELAQALGWPINTLTPRVYELRRHGAVVEAGKRLCGITGRLCMTWRPATRLEWQRFNDMYQRELPLY